MKPPGAAGAEPNATTLAPRLAAQNNRWWSPPQARRALTNRRLRARCINSPVCFSTGSNLLQPLTVVYLAETVVLSLSQESNLRCQRRGDVLQPANSFHNIFDGTRDLPRINLWGGCRRCVPGMAIRSHDDPRHGDSILPALVRIQYYYISVKEVYTDDSQKFLETVHATGLASGRLHFFHTDGSGHLCIPSTTWEEGTGFISSPPYEVTLAHLPSVLVTFRERRLEMVHTRLLDCDAASVPKSVTLMRSARGYLRVFR